MTTFKSFDKDLATITGESTRVPNARDKHGLRSSRHRQSLTSTSSSSCTPGQADSCYDSMEATHAEWGYSSPDLTPTGRVKVAKKGKRVHKCSICPKMYTRNEHLKRHQQTHLPRKYGCNFAHCPKSFHRTDLLKRHQATHVATPLTRSTSTPSLARPAMSSATEYSMTVTHNPAFADRVQEEQEEEEDASAEDVHSEGSSSLAALQYASSPDTDAGQLQPPPYSDAELYHYGTPFTAPAGLNDNYFPHTLEHRTFQVGTWTDPAMPIHTSGPTTISLSSIHVSATVPVPGPFHAHSPFIDGAESPYRAIYTDSDLDSPYFFGTIIPRSGI